MAIWTYRALTAGGRAQAGVVDAETSRAAWETLRARGVSPSELGAEEAPRRGGRRVRPAELAAATRELATPSSASTSRP